MLNVLRYVNCFELSAWEYVSTWLKQKLNISSNRNHELYAISQKLELMRKN